MTKQYRIFLFFLFLCFLQLNGYCAKSLKGLLCAAACMVPYKTCVTFTMLLYCIREFPHLQAHTSFDDGKCYSKYGTNINFYVLHLHGWGIYASANTFTPQNADDVYIVSPRFSETTEKKIFSTCFGQDNDVMISLKALSETHHVSDKIHVVAHCRGATVFFNLIAVLSTPNHAILNKLNINEIERQIILEKFKRGKSIIISPLLSIKQVLRHWFTAPLGSFIHHYILSWITKYYYNPTGKDVLQTMSQWTVSIPIQVLLPEQDDFVGTSLREEFIETLKQKNGSLYTRISILKGETHHWPPFLKRMNYKKLFQFY